MTNYAAEHNHSHLEPVTLYNTSIPYTNKVKILGVTYDNAMRFGDHIADITQKCAPKLRALKAITGQDFGQKKETNITLFKQYYRPTIEYCSTAFAPHLSKTNMDKLQVHQNNALRTAIGTTKTTPIDHLHREAKTLKIKDHMDMRGAQFCV